MSKRLQVVLTEEAWNVVNSVSKECNENFEVGSVNFSDIVNEMILSSRVDVKALQAKHTDVRRSLRVLASKGTVDIDSVIKSLMDLKSKTAKRGKSSQNPEESGA